MKRLVHACLLSLLASLNFCHPLQAQPSAQWQWSRAKWTVDDRPYTQIRERIGEQIKAKTLNDEALRTLRAASLKKPDDALLRFKWACYAYGLATLQADFQTGESKLSRLMEAYEANPSPNVYQYARMRYLVLSYERKSGVPMARLGERLLQRDPKDLAAKYFLVSHLFTGIPTDKAKSIKYAQELIQAKPHEPAYYSLLGYVYQNQWWADHDPATAQKSIANYRKYAELAKLTGARQRNVETTIKSMQGH